MFAVIDAATPKNITYDSMLATIRKSIIFDNKGFVLSKFGRISSRIIFIDITIHIISINMEDIIFNFNPKYLSLPLISAIEHNTPINNTTVTFICVENFIPSINLRKLSSLQYQYKTYC